MVWRGYILKYTGLREDLINEDLEWDGIYSNASRFKGGLE